MIRASEWLVTPMPYAQLQQTFAVPQQQLATGRRKLPDLDKLTNDSPAPLPLALTAIGAPSNRTPQQTPK